MAKTRTMIIVEEDSEDKELLTEALLQIGFKQSVKFFRTAEDALLYLQNTEEYPFLILSNINLPGMNGLEFHTAIEKDDYLRMKTIPFIFFTNAEDSSYVEKAYARKVQGFFLKPSTFIGMKLTLFSITDYWDRCLHPGFKKR